MPIDPTSVFMEYRDYYQTLGVARDADADTIKRAYRKMARRYHPDVSKEKDSEAQFKTVAEAYEVLKDPEKRAAYDQFGANWQQGQKFEPPPEWGGGANGGFGAGGDSFSDFFETLFGRGGGFSQQPRTQGEDVEATLNINIEDAYQGSTRSITLSLPGRQGQASGQSKTLNVKIPKGIQAGQRIRLEGQGGVGPGGKGDLYLRVQYLPHPRFTAEGKDVLVTVPVKPWQAALGRAVKIPTLGGEVSMKVPPGVRSGQRLRLKGRGLPGSPPGDQYAVVELTVPAADNEEIKGLYEALEKASDH